MNERRRSSYVRLGARPAPKSKTRRPPGLALAWIVLVLAGVIAGPALGQRAAPPGRWGIGAQVGSPSGLTLKHYLKRDVAIDFLASWGFDRSVLATVHLAYDYLIPESPLGVYLGPGFQAGRHPSPRGRATRFGLSTVAGLHYFTRRFEVFLQARPHMELLPESRVRMGGAAGLRYYVCVPARSLGSIYNTAADPLS